MTLNASVGRSCFKCLKCTWDKTVLLPKDHPWRSWIAHPPCIGPLRREAAPLVSPLLLLCLVSVLKARPSSCSSLGPQRLEYRCPVHVCWLCSTVIGYRISALSRIPLSQWSYSSAHSSTRQTFMFTHGLGALGTVVQRGVQVPAHSLTDRWLPVPGEKGFDRGVYLVGGCGWHFMCQGVRAGCFREEIILALETGIFFFFFLAIPRGMRDLSSPTRDWTHAPCSGSAES